MLERTGRAAVPIRRTFLQADVAGVDGDRGSALSRLVRSRDGAALNAYLLIHAMASSSEPFDAEYPAGSWVRALGLDEDAEDAGARSHWSKITARLVSLGLITRGRRGNRTVYTLLHEAGSREPYTRPKTIADGVRFSLPYTFWQDEHDQTLSLPERAMLLIALDQPSGFTLPLDRMPEWYGISPSTAMRGLSGLRQRELLTYRTKWRVDPKSPIGWAEERGYRLLSSYSTDIIRAATRRRPVRKDPIYFSEDRDKT